MGTRARVRQWSQDRLNAVIARAAAAGHDVNQLVTRQSSPGVQRGTYAICTCGWESSPRRPVAAATAALFHAEEVCAVLDQRKRLDLVEWSSAPPSPALRTRLTREYGPASHNLSDHG